MKAVGLQLLLDAHVSGPRVATRLRELGYDVKAVDEERSLDGMNDADILDLAASSERVVVTFNARHFVPLAREWAAMGKSHAGCVVLVGIRQNEFGLIIETLGQCLQARPDPTSWRDLTVLLGRGPRV